MDGKMYSTKHESKEIPIIIRAIACMLDWLFPVHEVFFYGFEEDSDD